MNCAQKQRLIAFAAGGRVAELVLKNATIVDVFTGTLFEADIAIQEGFIVGVGSYHGEREIDLTGRFVAPGFIDAHMHIESSMLVPSLFSAEVLPFGTTTLIADPHEIVNVAGAEGFRYMLEESEAAAANIYFMLPSSVPADRLANNGGVFDAEDMKPFLNHPRVLGLGEVMNPQDVISSRPDITQKIDLMGNRPIDGHAPALTGKGLQAYRLAGIQTDHECDNFEQALEKLRAGFTVQIREGSAAKNSRNIITGALKAGISLEHFVFCTDDKHPTHIRTEGHIDGIIRTAIALGVAPVTAYQMATLNAARLYGLEDLGAVAPGRRADLVVLRNLERVEIESVYKVGVMFEKRPKRAVLPDFPALRMSVRITALPEDCFSLSPFGPFPVIGLCDRQITTCLEMTELPTDSKGEFAPGNDLLKIAVVQRHDHSGRVGVGVIRGFGLQNGAIASTVSHDSHNLIVVGDNDSDMLSAVEALKTSQGGYVIVSAGKVSLLPLPIAGLMNDDPDYDLESQLSLMLSLARSLGVKDGVDPFMTLSFMALTAIPEIRITDYSVYDAVNHRFLTGTGQHVFK